MNDDSPNHARRHDPANATSELQYLSIDLVYYIRRRTTCRQAELLASSRRAACLNLQPGRIPHM